MILISISPSHQALCLFLFDSFLFPSLLKCAHQYLKDQDLQGSAEHRDYLFAAAYSVRPHDGAQLSVVHLQDSEPFVSTCFGILPISLSLKTPNSATRRTTSKSTIYNN